MRRLGRFLRYILPVAVFSLIIAWVMYPAFTAPPGYALFGDDFYRSYGFFREFFAQSIKSGRIPWWNPYLFSGTPFLANPSLSYLYPPNLLYVIFAAPFAWTVLTAAHVLLAMGGMFLLMRKALKLDIIAATGAGLSYGLSGYFVARIWAGHSEIISSAAYLPLVVCAFMYAFESRRIGREVLAAAGILSLQILAGYQTIALFTLEAVFILAVVRAVLRRSVWPLVILAGVLFLAFGMSAVQLLPNIEYFRESIRTYAFGYDWASYGSIRIRNLTQLIFPFALGDKIAYAGTPPNYPEQAMFAGAISIVLATIGTAGMFILKGTHRGTRIAFGVTAIVIAAFAVWVSLGVNAPVNIHRVLWEIVPLYRNLRIPPRHLLLLVFSVSAFAGYGIQIIRPRVLQWVAVIIMLVELIPFAGHFIEVRPVPGTRHDRELIGIIKNNQAEPGRLLQNYGVWVPPRDSLDFDAVMPYGIFSATGYDPSILKEYYRFADSVNGTFEPSILQHDVQIPYLNVWSPYLNFLNIRYILVPRAYDPVGGERAGKFALVREDAARDYRLYENLEAYPRFYMVRSLEVSPDRDAVFEAIRQGEADLSNTVLTWSDRHDELTGYKPDCPDVRLPPVELVSYDVNRIEIRTTASCSAFMSTSEVMYPGWRVYIDGKKTDIIEGNGAFRALYVPGGEHAIVFTYFPEMFAVGAVLSGITIIFVLIVYIRKRRVQNKPG